MFRDFGLAIWNRAYRTDFIKMNDILYKNEDELVRQVIDSLEIMLNKKECLL